MRTILKVAWRSIWRNRRRTLISMSAVGLGLVLVIFYGGLLGGALGDAKEQLDNVGIGHVEITAPGWRTHRAATESLADPEALLARLALPARSEVGWRVVAAASSRAHGRARASSCRASTGRGKSDSRRTSGRCGRPASRRRRRSRHPDRREARGTAQGQAGRQAARDGATGGRRAWGRALPRPRHLPLALAGDLGAPGPGQRVLGAPAPGHRRRGPSDRDPARPCRRGGRRGDAAASGARARLRRALLRRPAAAAQDHGAARRQIVWMVAFFVYGLVAWVSSTRC